MQTKELQAVKKSTDKDNDKANKVLTTYTPAYNAEIDNNMNNVFFI